ncbi:MAG TPA: class I SAM-dependent methyltransferase [Cyclobacteriaceae bacterium]
MGSIHVSGNRIFRSISRSAAPQYLASREVLRSLVAERRLVDFVEVPPPDGLDCAYLLEHPSIAPWTMPYEWSFSLLQAAALFHLDLQLDLIERGFNLSDASAYNVQFIGPQPIFIDHLSIRPYVEGEFWAGHRQFCEQFLNPLLLRAYCDVAPNSWYRGELEGIPSTELAKLLPLRSRLKWSVLANVFLPAQFQAKATSDREASSFLKNRKLPKQGLKGMLLQLRRLVSGLRPANMSATTWANYATTTTYDNSEAIRKKDLVSEFVRRSNSKTVIDLGCNTGEFSAICLKSGASSVIGFDFDQQALDKAFHRAKAENLNFLPLYLDARNPSPSQGWMQTERPGFSERFVADAVLALAFEHHLAIAHNVPLEQVVRWITNIAQVGLIEFVPKTDPTIRKMLALREDIFTHYDEKSFQEALDRCARIVAKEQITSTGRTVFEYARRS